MPLGSFGKKSLVMLGITRKLHSMADWNSCLDPTNLSVVFDTFFKSHCCGAARIKQKRILKSHVSILYIGQGFPGVTIFVSYTIMLSCWYRIQASLKLNKIAPDDPNQTPWVKENQRKQKTLWMNVCSTVLLKIGFTIHEVHEVKK